MKICMIWGGIGEGSVETSLLCFCMRWGHARVQEFLCQKTALTTFLVLNFTEGAQWLFQTKLYIYIVLGGVAEVVGSNLARGKIFTASIGSVDSLYPSVFIYCLNLHQFLILCSSKAMMFVKLYFRTSDIYLISLVSLDPSGFHLRTK